MLSTCWLLFFHSADQLNTKPSQLGVGQVIRDARSSVQHSITLLLGQIAPTQPGGVLDHCPVEKQMIIPLSVNQMRWRIAAKCCGSHAG